VSYFRILGLAIAIGLSGLPVHTSPASSAEVLVADTAMTTARGAIFTAPTGWRVDSAANKIVLEPPEADSHLAVLEVQATDAAAAVAAAWADYRADAKRPLRIATPQGGPRPEAIREE